MQYEEIEHSEQICLNTLGQDSYLRLSWVLIRSLGIHEAAILSFIIDKYRHFMRNETIVDDAWFFIENSYFEETLKLTRYQREKAVGTLEFVGVIERQAKVSPYSASNAPKVHYRLVFEKILSLLQQPQDVNTDELKATRKANNREKILKQRKHLSNINKSSKKAFVEHQQKLRVTPETVENTDKDEHLSNISKSKSICRTSTTPFVEHQQNIYRRSINNISTAATAHNEHCAAADAVCSSGLSHITTEPYEIDGTPQQQAFQNILNKYAFISAIELERQLVTLDISHPGELEKAIAYVLPTLKKPSTRSLFAYIAKSGLIFKGQAVIPADIPIGQIGQANVAPNLTPEQERALQEYRRQQEKKTHGNTTTSRTAAPRKTSAARS